MHGRQTENNESAQPTSLRRSQAPSKSGRGMWPNHILRSHVGSVSSNENGLHCRHGPHHLPPVHSRAPGQRDMGAESGPCPLHLGSHGAFHSLVPSASLRGNGGAAAAGVGPHGVAKAGQNPGLHGGAAPRHSQLGEVPLRRSHGDAGGDIPYVSSRLHARPGDP